MMEAKPFLQLVTEYFGSFLTGALIVALGFTIIMSNRMEWLERSGWLLVILIIDFLVWRWVKV